MVCKVLIVQYRNEDLLFHVLFIEKESEFKELLERERQARMKAEETVEHKTELLRLKEAEHEDTLNHYRQQVADLSSLLKKVDFSICLLNKVLLHSLCWL
jgi:hypothetical protein